MNQTDREIVRCPACGAGNRLPPEKMGSNSAKCGRCKALLFPEKPRAAAGSYKMRCSGCGARNRIPGERLDSAPKCGKCGTPLQTSELFAPQPVMVTDANFKDKVLKSPLPVLLFAWAPWCPTCGSVIPIVDEFASESNGKVRVGKVNIDANPNLAARYSIMSVPFLFIFDNGQLKESMPGALQKHDLMLKMAPYI